MACKTRDAPCTPKAFAISLDKGEDAPHSWVTDWCHRGSLEKLARISPGQRKKSRRSSYFLWINAGRLCWQVAGYLRNLRFKPACCGFHQSYSWLELCPSFQISQTKWFWLGQYGIFVNLKKLLGLPFCPHFACNEAHWRSNWHCFGSNWSSKIGFARMSLSPNKHSHLALGQV